MANDVLDHDHRAIHDHAEIQRAQGEKIGGNLAQVEPYGSKEQGEWNGERDDQGRPGIAEKQEQDDGHQNHPFRQVVHHRARGVAQQVAAVQHGHDLHARRQNAVVELVDFFVNGIQRGLLFCAFAHQHHALNDIGFIDNPPVLHVVGPGHVPQPDLRALRHLRDIFYPQRGAGLRFQDGLLDIQYVAEEPERANIHLLQAFFDKAAAGIDVVVGQLLLDLPDAQSVGDEFGRVNPHLVFAHRAPEVGNIHHVGNGLELL